MWRTVCSRVCSHINRLGWEVSVCSDRSGVDGVLRRLLCEKEVNFFLKSAIPIYPFPPTFLTEKQGGVVIKPENLYFASRPGKKVNPTGVCIHPDRVANPGPDGPTKSTTPPGDTLRANYG